MRSSRSRQVWLMTLSLMMLSLISSQARGDILFLDLNNNPKEIEAAQKAARARGERLIVRPIIPAAVQRNMQDASRELWAAAESLRKSKCSGKDTSECKPLNQQYKKATDKMREVMERYPSLDQKSLSADLAKLKADKTSLSSVIISGHDGNGHFSGTQGSVSDTGIDAAFKANAPLGDSVRSLLLWGCYTTNLGALEYHWKGIFPNANMIAGYDGKAPLGDKPANWAYLEDVLKKEKKLTEARDKAALAKIFKSISGANQVNSAICVHSDDVVTLDKVVSIKDEMEKCKSDGSEAMQKKYYCYAKAEPGCEDLPKETGSGPIREFYEYLQNTHHCTSLLEEQGVIRPSPDEVLRLIFDRQVRENFEKLYEKDIAELNKLLEQLGLPDNLRLKDLSHLTRKEYIDRIRAIGDELDKKYESARNEVGEVEDVDVFTAVVLYRMLKRVPAGANCVPFSWVEPNARELSSCSQEPALAARKSAEQQVRVYALNSAERKILRQNSKSDELKQLASQYDRVSQSRADERLQSGNENGNPAPDTQAVYDQRAPSQRSVVRQLGQELSHLSERYYRVEAELDQESAPAMVKLYEDELKKVRPGEDSKDWIETLERRLHRWQKSVKKKPIESNDSSSEGSDAASPRRTPTR